MSDLVNWMRAQLDADADAANIISSGGYVPQTWHAGPAGPGHVGVLLFAEDRVIGDPPGCVERSDEPFAVVIGGRAEYAHIVCWDPARAIAEIDAKRRVLELYEVSASRQINPDGWELMKHAVRALALPYADRPGYREEWRP